MKARRLRTASLRDCALWRLSDGRRAFIKIAFSDLPDIGPLMRAGIERERTCLQVLRGLAVPTLLKLKRSELPYPLRDGDSCYIAESYAGDRSLHALNLDRPALIGAWLFVAEQLAAFRGRGILYSDFKCGNICGTRRPFRVTVIDFGACGPLIPGKKYLAVHGYTPGMQSPEITRGERATERSLVYEFSCLLLHFVTGQNTAEGADPRLHLARGITELGDMEAPDLAGLLQACLSVDPKLRPKNYEELLKKLRAIRLPSSMTNTWNVLRAPYVDALRESGIVAP